MRWLIATCLLLAGAPPALAKEFGVVEDLYVGRNLISPHGGFGAYANLLLHSQDFGQAAWVKTTASVAANVTAPDGASNAGATLTASSANGNIAQTVAAGASTAYTASVWLQAGTSTAAQIALTGNGTGETADTQAVTLDATWQRVSVSHTTLASTTQATVTIKNTGAAGSTILVWGAQLEPAATAGVYVKTSAAAVPAARGLISDGKTTIQGDVDLGDTLANTIRLRGTVKGSSPTLVVNQDTTADIVDFQDSGVSVFKIADGGAITAAGPLTVDSPTFHVDSATDRVGIGTTAPAQKLHVEGQCVTGDTLLAIARPAAQGAGRRAQGVAIKDVQAGMLVYSLNEATGALEFKPIRALMDMGVKPVYQLTTNTGRTIRTTGNHPYLTRDGWRRVAELAAGTAIAVPTAAALAAVGLTPQLHPLHEERLARDIKREPIRADSEPVRRGRQVDERLGEMQRLLLRREPLEFAVDPALEVSWEGRPFALAAGGQGDAMHDAGGYARRSARSMASNGTQPLHRASATASLRDWTYASLTGSWVSSSSMSQPAGLAAFEWYSASERRSTSRSSIVDKTSKSAQASKTNTLGVPARSTTTPAREPRAKGKTDFGATRSHGSSVASASAAGSNFFLRMPDLRATTGSSITRPPEASIHRESIRAGLAWEAIASIEYLGQEPVYDIEVEGTHNFVANGILAHNTYLSGNVGIGTTNPSSFKLQVAGSIGPDADNAYDIGSSGNRVRNVFVKGNIYNYSGQSVYIANTSQWIVAGVPVDNTFRISESGVGDAVIIQPTSDDVSLRGRLVVSGTGNTTIAGNVGIGTTAPNAALDVRGTTAETLRLYATDAMAADVGSRISILGKYKAAGDFVHLAEIFGRKENATEANTAGYLAFLTTTAPSTAASEKMRITSSGNVGIGTTAPGAKLEVETTNQYDGIKLWDSTGNGAGASQITFGDNTGTNTAAIRFTNNFGATTNEVNGNSLILRALVGSGDVQIMGGNTASPLIGTVFKNNGNVGIGTTNPGANLDVAGTGIFSSQVISIGSITGLSNERISLKYDGSGATGQLTGASGVGLGFGTNAIANRVYLDTSGNVGIGTTGPSSKLDVTTAGLAATQTTSSGLALVNTTAATALAPQQISPAIRWSGFGWKTDVTAASQAVDFRSYVVPVQGAANPTGYLAFESSVNGGAYSATPPFVITTGGNIGIGTTAPGSKLEITGGSVNVTTAYSGYNVTGQRYLFQDNTGFGVGVSVGTPDASVPLAFYAGGGVKMGITTAGNVGIGTTAPGQKLDVRTPNESGDVQLRLGSVGGNVFDIGRRVADGFLSIQGSQTGANSILLAPTSGNVGIGTTAPGSALDVKGTLRLSGATSGFVGLAPAAAAGAVTYTLPSADGASGQVLSTNGGGVLAWTTVSTSEVDTLATVTARGATTATGVGLTQKGNLAADYALYLKRNTDVSPLGYLLQAQNAAGTSTLFAVDVSGAITAGTLPWASVTSRSIVDVDIAATAAIAKSKLAALNIADADVAATAAIAKSKISATGAWTAAEIPTLDWTKIDTATNKVLLASQVSGTLPVANGGTGTATGSITGTGALTFAAGGTNQNVTLTPSGTGYTLLNGNVGIGTTSPTAGKLQILAPVGTAGIYLDTPAGYASNLLDLRSNTNLEATIGATGILGLANNNIIINPVTGVFDLSATHLDFTLRTAGSGDDINFTSNALSTPAMTILGSNGNVGIGTTSPIGFDVTNRETQTPLLDFGDVFSDYVVTGLLPATSLTLTSDLSAGTAYVVGRRIRKAAATSKTYTASKDTYVDLDQDATLVYTEVLTGAAAPAVAANALRLAKVVTSATAITGVTDLRATSTNLTGVGAVNSSGNLTASGNLQVTGAGPHYIANGNVGIGTTAPAQKLHVEGQCVTGDTLLAIAVPVARDSGLGTRGGVEGGGRQVEGVQIKDVQAGMQVYSLNETTGQLEPHRINGLLDMGIQPVFKLTTASGKTIRTTGNHPYLTRAGWRKVVEIQVGENIAVPNAVVLDGFLQALDGALNDRVGNEQAALVIQPIQGVAGDLDGQPSPPDTVGNQPHGAVHVDPEALRRRSRREIISQQGHGAVVAGQRETIQLAALQRHPVGQLPYVAAQGLAHRDDSQVRPAEDRAQGPAPAFNAEFSNDTGRDHEQGEALEQDQVADLVQMDERSGINDNLIHAPGPRPDPVVWPAAVAPPASRPAGRPTPRSSDARAASAGTDRERSPDTTWIGQVQQLLPALWPEAHAAVESAHPVAPLGSDASRPPRGSPNYSTRPSPLSNGDGEITWEAMVSIEAVGREQVYDIEVEGTHNFVANGILAHNTYLSGNVGIATSTPGGKFEVRDTLANGIAAGVYQNATSGTVFGLVVQANGSATTEVGGQFDAIGGTNNRAIQTTTDTAAGANNYAIYSASPAQSYFAGNVGIGTTAPETTLHVAGSKLRIGANGVANGSIAALEFRTSTNNDIAADIQATRYPYGGTLTLGARYLWGYQQYMSKLSLNDDATIRFYTNPDVANQAPAEVMRIGGSGLVGIGTTAPAARLHISGTQAGDGSALRLANTTATTGRTYKIISKDDGTAEFIVPGTPDKVVARMGVK